MTLTPIVWYTSFIMHEKVGSIFRTDFSVLDDPEAASAVARRVVQRNKNRSAQTDEPPRSALRGNRQSGEKTPALVAPPQRR